MRVLDLVVVRREFKIEVFPKSQFKVPCSGDSIHPFQFFIIERVQVRFGNRVVPQRERNRLIERTFSFAVTKESTILAKIDLMC